MLVAFLAWATVLLAICYVLKEGYRLVIERNASEASVQLTTACTWGFLIVGSAVFFFVDPLHASNFPISDSIEFAVAAHRAALLGSFDILVENVAYPPRYSPWFPLLILAPLYHLLGAEIGNAIYATTFFAVLGVATAYLLGILVAARWGGLLAVALLLTVPGYRYFGRQVMTDVPFVTVVLLALLVYLVIVNGKSVGWKHYACAGIILALGYWLRPLAVALLVPFVALPLIYRSPGNLVIKLLLLCFPILGFVVATLVYNAAVFGDYFRTGYHFWVPVPYDYLDLTFSVQYLSKNFEVLYRDVGLGPLLGFGLALLLVQKGIFKDQKKIWLGKKVFVQSMIFFALVAVPLLSFHLFYFYSSSRFFLPLRVLLTVLVGGLAGRLVSKAALDKRAPVLIAGFACLVMVLYGWNVKPDFPDIRATADRIADNTFEDATIISKLNPIYFQLLVQAGTQRTLLPWSREVEYASKAVAWRRVSVLDPPPINWEDHRAEGLLRGGANDPILRVAQDDPRIVGDLINAGREVFVDTSAFSLDEVKLLTKSYRLEPITESLYWIHLAQKSS
ncbi:glycosyltransferase family 39 protein [Oligoflexia bacterium]|nr:glycosyltransferase family 39 protein [Oligoflexia bacterium]